MYLSPERKTKRKWTQAQLEARKRMLLGTVQDEINNVVTKTKIEKAKEERDQVK
ncbi:MAG: hypothetical protein GTO02_16425 [Candidatus Dadabacteria bacterium]|nr:hypothetical protein [Candidatus Dadabacteria bacterium]